MEHLWSAIMAFWLSIDDVFKYHQLKTRRALSLFNNVPLRTRRALSPYRLCTALAPFWLLTKHLWTSLMPFWLSTDDMKCIWMKMRVENKWRVSSQNALYPFWSIWDIWDLSCWNIKKIIRKFVTHFKNIPFYIMSNVSLERYYFVLL